MVTMLDIPMEVMTLVFQFLDHSTKVTARKVCIKWKDVLDEHFLTYLTLLTNKNAHLVLNATIQFDKLEIKNLTREISSTCSEKFRLKNDKSPKTIVFLGPGKRKKRTTEDLVSSDTLKMLLQCYHTENLVFQKKSLRLLPNFPADTHELPFDNLESLTLDGETTETRSDKLVFDRIAEVRMPRLRKVQLCWQVQQSQSQNEDTYLMLFQFLVQHHSTLKDVTIFHVFTRGHVRKQGVAILASKAMLKLRNDLARIQLDKLIIQFDRYEGIRDFTLGHHLMESQSSLETLGVSMRSHSAINVTKIKEALERNHGTIIEFLVESRNRVDGTRIQEAICACHKLEFLKMINFEISSFSHKLPKTIKKINFSGELSGHQILPDLLQLPNLENLRYLDMKSYPASERNAIKLHIQKIRLITHKLKYLLWHTKDIHLEEFQDHNLEEQNQPRSGVKLKAGLATFIRRWSYPDKVIYFRNLPYLYLQG